ncbi:YqgE/AlgH family protein [Kitasatospora sp. NPDC049285]|uniref:YqgE/AlgH family protein n=1 Tax=Kitasatospora sp. NPDC049285 TaxID=3157096 RepID=UPI00342BB121
MAGMKAASSLTGRLLVATPLLTDPNFARSVVLLLDHDPQGALGVVLNRPTPVDVSAVLDGWGQLTGQPAVVFQGGPVALDSALALAVVPGEDDQPGPLGWRRVHGAIGLVDLEAPPEVLAGELGGLRVFAGYAGWSPGQLEQEIAEGAWHPVDCEVGDVCCLDPDGLWRAVLRRQRGPLAMLATYPDDPTLN